MLGQTAAHDPSFRPPEPYKGKGVRYTGEKVREKAGKAGGGKGSASSGSSAIGSEQDCDMAKTKIEGRARRKLRIRKKVEGTAERPRLTVFRSNKQIYAQVIDDATGKTIAAARRRSAASKAAATRAASARRAEQVGAAVASAAWRRASRRSCSTATATSITAASKPWPTAHAKAGLSF